MKRIFLFKVILLILANTWVPECFSESSLSISDISHFYNDELPENLANLIESEINSGDLLNLIWLLLPQNKNEQCAINVKVKINSDPEFGRLTGTISTVGFDSKTEQLVANIALEYLKARSIGFSQNYGRLLVINKILLLKSKENSLETSKYKTYASLENSHIVTWCLNEGEKSIQKNDTIVYQINDMFKWIYEIKLDANGAPIDIIIKRLNNKS